MCYYITNLGLANNLKPCDTVQHPAIREPQISAAAQPFPKGKFRQVKRLDLNFDKTISICHPKHNEVKSKYLINPDKKP